MTAAREQRRLTALHEYELLDMPAGDEPEAVVGPAVIAPPVLTPLPSTPS